MDSNYLIVLYAQADTEPKVLMTETRLSRVQGSKSARGDTPNLIPNNAGQWTLPGGETSSSQSASDIAFQLFNDATGFNLADPSVATRYGLSAPKIQKLQDVNYNPLTVLYIETNVASLDNLTDDINTSLNNPRSLLNPVYDIAQTMGLAKALSEIGPIPAPEKGWRAYIVNTFYGGQIPGALDMTFPTLVTQIDQRSRMSGEFFRLALQNVPGGSQPVRPRLVRFDVENAQRVEGTEDTYGANYDPSQNVTIHAIVEPRDAGSEIAWEGGSPDPMGRPDYRIVPLAQITRVGAPLSVTASLGSAKLGFHLIIRPLLARFAVANAEKSTDPSEENVWVAEYSESEAPIQITISMTPDSPEAYEYLQWTGGSPNPDGHKNSRLIPRNVLTAPDNPVRVRAAVNPWWDFILYVLPRLQQLEVVAGAGVYNPGGNNYQVDYQAGATYTVRATTLPNIALAHQFLSWNTGAVGANQITPNRHPINPFGASSPYTVAIVRRGMVLRSLSINVTVQPIVTALDYSGYVFTPPGGSYTYVSGGALGLPNNQVRVTATTDPNNAGAWAYLQWQNTNGAGATLAERVVNRNIVQNVAVSAQVGQAPAFPAPLDVRAQQAWPNAGPENGLQLQVNQITFAGGRAVVHDDPGNVGNAYNRNWVRGTAHAAQSPETYTRNTNVNQGATIGVAAAPAGNVAVDIRATAFVPLANGTLHPIEWQWNANNVLAAVPPPVVLANLAANVNLPNEVVYADPLFILWEMRVGVNNWILFDATSHMFYVTLGNPANYTINGLVPAAAAVPYFTLLAISCQAANGVNNAANLPSTVFNAFAAITPVTGVNANFARKPAGIAPNFTYWDPTVVPATNPQPLVSQSMVNLFNNATSRGACGTWAHMFICMGALHGVNSLDYVEVTINPVVAPGNTGAFLVKNWTFWGPAVTNAAAYTHNFAPYSPLPAPPNSSTWGPGPGQNNQTPPPRFLNHFIVVDTVDNSIYDPSYGITSRGGPLPMNNWRNWAALAVGGYLNLAGTMTGYVRPFFPLPALPALVRLQDRVTAGWLP